MDPISLAIGFVLAKLASSSADTKVGPADLKPATAATPAWPGTIFGPTKAPPIGTTPPPAQPPPAQPPPAQPPPAQPPPAQPPPAQPPPAQPPPAPASRTYTIASGDMAYSVAKRFSGTSELKRPGGTYVWKELAISNPGMDTSGTVPTPWQPAMKVLLPPTWLASGPPGTGAKGAVSGGGGGLVTTVVGTAAACVAQHELDEHGGEELAGCV